MICCLRQLQEKCADQDRPLYMVFVDFSKAIDKVGRTGLWQLLSKYGCPENFTQLWSRHYIPEWWRMLLRSHGIVQCHKWGQARLCTGPHALLHLLISNVRQGSPRHRGWRLHTVQTARWPIQRRTLQSEDQYYMRELLFADNSALVAHSAEEMQKIVDVFSDVSKKFGLKVNIRKTKVMYQRKSTRTREEDIMVDGNKLNSILEFIYIGITISSNGCIDDELQKRVAKVNASFGRLHQRFWNNHHVLIQVKGNIYRSIMLSTLLYRAEAWTVYRRQEKKLHAFMMRHLRSIMRVTWMDKVTNNTELPSMEDLLIRKNLRWTGNLMRMSPGRLPKQVLYSQLSSGPRKRGRLVSRHHSHSREINGEE